MFICVMFMASLEFHWAISEHALFDSPVISVGWAVTVVLLCQCIFITMHERYDYFTRSKHSQRYRPRRRLLAWECAHLASSLALVGVSFYITRKIVIFFFADRLKGWSALVAGACKDSRSPGCGVAIAADTLLGIFALIQLAFVIVVCHYVCTGRGRRKRENWQNTTSDSETEFSSPHGTRYIRKETRGRSISPRGPDRGQMLSPVLICTC